MKAAGLILGPGLMQSAAPISALGSRCENHCQRASEKSPAVGYHRSESTHTHTHTEEQVEKKSVCMGEGGCRDNQRQKLRGPVCISIFFFFLGWWREGLFIGLHRGAECAGVCVWVCVGARCRGEIEESLGWRAV